MMTVISVRGIFASRSFKSAAISGMLEQSGQQFGSFRGKPVLRTDQWRMFAADIEHAPQITIRNPGAAASATPRTNGSSHGRLNCKSCPAFAFSSHSDKKVGLPFAAFGDRFRQLGVCFRISDALEQQHLGENRLVHADAMSLRDRHADSERIQKAFDQSRISDNPGSCRHEVREPVRRVELTDQSRLANLSCSDCMKARSTRFPCHV